MLMKEVITELTDSGTVPEGVIVLRCPKDKTYLDLLPVGVVVVTSEWFYMIYALPQHALKYDWEGFTDSMFGIDVFGPGAKLEIVGDKLGVLVPDGSDAS